MHEMSQISLIKKRPILPRERLHRLEAAEQSGDGMLDVL
jgi:hypothetical protein